MKCPTCHSNKIKSALYSKNTPNPKWSTYMFAHVNTQEALSHLVGTKKQYSVPNPIPKSPLVSLVKILSHFKSQCIIGGSNGYI
jgi:hypothetical protein